MRAEETLQMMADFYGDLFPTRKSALDHLFCVIGNGYKWIDGELIDTDNETTSRYRLVKPIKDAKFRRLDDPDEIYKWYPIVPKYSYICNYPANIKADWFELLNECRSLLEADGISVPYPHESNGWYKIIGGHE